MIITVIRHGKVLHTWKKWCSSSEFDEQCRLYDSAPIENMTSTNEHKATKVHISTLDRSLQTARMLFGDMTFYSTDKINEVPIKSAFDTKLHLPVWFWHVSGRLQWIFNFGRQPETRSQTRERAEQFVKELINCGEDSVLVTHGFFMHTLIATMKQHGFRQEKARFHYKNGEAIVLEIRL
jgi:broad specificity phosphatase PhoE